MQARQSKSKGRLRPLPLRFFSESSRRVFSLVPFNLLQRPKAMGLLNLVMKELHVEEVVEGEGVVAGVLEVEREILSFVGMFNGSQFQYV